MGHTACTEPQCLYKGDLYLFLVISVDAQSLLSYRECFAKIIECLCHVLLHLILVSSDLSSR